MKTAIITGWFSTLAVGLMSYHSGISSEYLNSGFFSAVVGFGHVSLPMAIVLLLVGALFGLSEHHSSNPIQGFVDTNKVLFDFTQPKHRGGLKLDFTSIQALFILPLLVALLYYLMWAAGFRFTHFSAPGKDAAMAGASAMFTFFMLGMLVISFIEVRRTKLIS